MISGLRPYPEMKDSGVDSLGSVPSHWEIAKLGHIGRLFKGNGASKEDEVLTGIPCIRYGDLYTRHNYFILDSRACISEERASDYTPIKFGDILFAASGETIDEIGKSAVNLIQGRAYCGGDVIVFRPKRGLDCGYMGYATDFRPAVSQKARMGRGFTVVHIYGDQLKKLAVPVPPIPEQTGIVRFLDHMDRRIQRYIRAKEKLIALLEEQKRAEIFEGITGKTNVQSGKPHEAYKGSGEGWVGKVPNHWGLKRLKWVARLQRGYDLPKDRRTPGPFPVVSSGGVIDRHSEARCPGPGVVMGRYGSTDAIFFVGEDFWPHNTSLFVTDFQGNNRKWCYYLLGAITKDEHAGKSAVPGIDRKDLFEIVVPAPPRHEQGEIVRAIDRRIDDIEKLSTKTRQEIESINEYRHRLISDVVTGKVDVREAATTLPESDRNNAEA